MTNNAAGVVGDVAAGVIITLSTLIAIGVLALVFSTARDLFLRRNARAVQFERFVERCSKLGYMVVHITIGIFGVLFCVLALQWAAATTISTATTGSVDIAQSLLALFGLVMALASSAFAVFGWWMSRRIDRVAAAEEGMQRQFDASLQSVREALLTTCEVALNSMPRVTMSQQIPVSTLHVLGSISALVTQGADAKPPANGALGVSHNGLRAHEGRALLHYAAALYHMAVEPDARSRTLERAAEELATGLPKATRQPRLARDMSVRVLQLTRQMRTPTMSSAARDALLCLEEPSIISCWARVVMAVWEGLCDAPKRRAAYTRAKDAAIALLQQLNSSSSHAAERAPAAWYYAARGLWVWLACNNADIRSEDMEIQEVIAKFGGASTCALSMLQESDRDIEDGLTLAIYMATQAYLQIARHHILQQPGAPINDLQPAAQLIATARAGVERELRLLGVGLRPLVYNDHHECLTTPEVFLEYLADLTSFCSEDGRDAFYRFHQQGEVQK